MTHIYTFKHFTVKKVHFRTEKVINVQKFTNVQKVYIYAFNSIVSVF